MKNGQDNALLVPSIPYSVVRCRQLEETYPGDPQMGCWPITAMRVQRGWGFVLQEAWPNCALENWPPVEPPGLDQIAKSNRTFRYQRIRTAHECLEAVRRRVPVMAAFEITRQWFDAMGGVIQNPEERTPIIGSHQVNIVGVEQVSTVMPGSERIRFIFENWWGRDWGNDGCGILPWDFFNRWLVEAWTMDLISPEKTRQDETYWTVPGVFGGIQYVGEINDTNQDERAAWTLVTPTRDFLDVEELFVRPAWRRMGYGTKLLNSLNNLSRSQNLPLRFLIPYADGEKGNLVIVRKMFQRIGYRVDVSGTRWAPYFGTFSPGSDITPYFPQKPALAPPKPASTEEARKQAEERGGVFDADFDKAAENVFKQHEELLRRLA